MKTATGTIDRMLACVDTDTQGLHVTAGNILPKCNHYHEAATAFLCIGDGIVTGLSAIAIHSATKRTREITARKPAGVRWWKE